MEITIIILAGGKSSRMGEDKGMMSLYEKPMVQHVIETAKKISEKISIISNNRNYEQFGLPVFPDSLKDKGPLAGMYEGLIRSDTEKNLILSCDIPYIGIDLLNFLIENSSGFQVTIPVYNQRVHPLIGVYTKNCASVFEDQIRARRFKVMDSFGNLAVNQLDAGQFPAQMFKNINNKRDL